MKDRKTGLIQKIFFDYYANVVYLPSYLIGLLSPIDKNFQKQLEHYAELGEFEIIKLNQFDLKPYGNELRRLLRVDLERRLI